MEKVSIEENRDGKIQSWCHHLSPWVQLSLKLTLTVHSYDSLNIPFYDLSQLELVYVTPNQRSLAQHSPHLIIRQLVDPKEIEKDQEMGLESGKNIYRKNWVGIMST